MMEKRKSEKVKDKKKTTIYLDKEIYREVKIKAAYEDLSISEIFEKAIREYLYG